MTDDLRTLLRLQGAALEAAANAILITDHEGCIVWGNPAFTSLTGYTAEEAIGNKPGLLRSGRQDKAFYGGMWRTILDGRVWQGELVNRRRDGTLYVESQTITPVRDAQGEISHFIAIKQDVTDRKLTEQALERQRENLHQSEKLAAMGQLLAGVAHELNNPLAVVVGQAFLLKERTGEGPMARRADQIGRAATRCARIVKNFLALARQYPPEREEMSLNQLVEESVELLAYPLRVDNVDVVLDLGPDLPSLWADPHQLQQVVINLVTNAHQALREVPCRDRRLTLTTRRALEAGRVRLRVADTGPGIAPEIRRRLFEPFFTTKPPGQGTGLGLSLCRGIVEEHGGTIAAESEPGQGAVFEVELPLGTPPAIRAQAEADVAVASVLGKTILIVDDDASITNLMAEILAMDGHRVDLAPNGAVALDKLGTERYDAVLSDIRMPELDGPGLWREVERRHPDVLRRFAFITGDVLSPETCALIQESGVPGLTKPFTADEVRRLVQRLIRDA